MNRCLAALSAALLLAACGDGEDGGNAANAATAVEPTPVPGQPTPVTPAITLPPGEGIPGVSAPPPAPAPLPTPASGAEGAVEADGPGPAAAADTLRRYFAAIDAGEFGAAYRFWDRAGAASGMDAAAFARSFRRYDGYRASIGEPGRIEPGAGQRYITIPVRVTGRVRGSGEPFVLAGPVTLHRTGPVDGATAEQRSWRIHESGLKPRPQSAARAAPPFPTPATTARYGCDDGRQLTAVFDNRADTVALVLAGTAIGTLSGQRPASGIWYRGEGYELRGKGDEAVLGLPGGRQLRCTA